MIDGANAEGHLTVFSQGSDTIQEGLTTDFQKDYPNIQVDFTGATGGEISTKLITERQAGQYNVDVVVHGTTTFITSLIPAGVLDPLPPALIGPDDSDPSQWLGGDYDWADAENQYDMIFMAGVKVPLIYNPSLVSPSDLSSYKSLLDPKWKGKIAMIDPRGAGSGLASVTFWYTTPSLGPDYVQQFFTNQDVALSTDDREVSDWVARGEYPIGLATQDFAALDLKARGVPIELLPAEDIQEGTYLTAAWGSVGIVNRAPHPNAARLYINWLLSEEGQADASKASGYPSRRLDASTEGLRDSVIPKPGVSYQDNSKEQYVLLKDAILNFLKPLLGS